MEILPVGGLTVNPHKCRLLALEVNKKHKQYFVDLRVFKATGVEIGMVSVTTTCIWGFCLDFVAEVKFAELLEEGFHNIKRSPLKFQQRMTILTQHHLLKLYHRFGLGKAYEMQHRCMDRQIRVVVRSWLQLPNDMSRAVFHTPAVQGELGVPDLASTICLFKQLPMSEDPVMLAAAIKHLIQRNILCWHGPANIGGTELGNSCEHNTA